MCIYAYVYVSLPPVDVVASKVPLKSWQMAPVEAWRVSWEHDLSSPLFLVKSIVKSPINMKVGTNCEN